MKQCFEVSICLTKPLLFQAKQAGWDVCERVLYPCSMYWCQGGGVEQLEFKGKHVYKLHCNHRVLGCRLLDPVHCL